MSVDVETQLRRFADEVLETVAPVTVEQATSRSRSTRRRRTRPALVAVGLAAAAAVVVGLLVVSDEDEADQVAAGGSSAPLAPGRADRWGDPVAIVGGGEAVWVAMGPPPDPAAPAGPSGAEGGIVRVDATTGEAQAWAAVDSMHSLAVSEGSLWATGFTTGVVTRIDAESGEMLAEITLPSPEGFEDIDGAFLPGHIAASAESVWVTTARGAAARIDPATNEITDVVAVEGNQARAVAADGPRAWVVEGTAGVALVEPGEEAVHLPVRAGGRSVPVGAVVVAGGSVWAGGPVLDAAGAIGDGGALARIDRETATVAEVLEVPEPVSALATLDDTVWVLGARGSLYRVTSDGAVEEVLGLGEEAFDLVGADGRLWSVDPIRQNLRVIDPSTGEISGQPLLDGSADDGTQILEPLDEPTDATVYLSTDTHLTVVDVDRNVVDTNPVGELAPGDPPYRLVARGDQLVFYGRDGTYRLDPAGGGQPTLLGPSLFFVPSAAPDRVWLVDRTGDGQDDRFTLREVDLAGNETVPAALAPPGRPVAAVTDGVVLQSGDDSLVVWDARSDEVRRRLPGSFPIAAAGNILAWCARPCRSLHVTDVATGEDQEVLAPDGTTFLGYEGAFSPDGRTIAVPLIAAGRDGSSTVALVDAEDGDVRTIPGARLSELGHLAWARSGDRLFFEMGEGQLGTFRLGSPTAQRLRANVPPSNGLAVG